MSDKQINSIQKRIYPEVITSKSYNRKWPRDLRYSHHNYCGLSMQDYRVERRLRKIQIMHRLLNHPKHTTLIQSILSFYQLSVGTSKQVLEYPNERINYVNSTWLRDLINFMERNNIKITIKKYMSIEIQRRKDKCTVDEVLQSNFTKSKLIQVNACRLYLQILYLSDIIEPDGKTVNHMYYS